MNLIKPQIICNLLGVYLAKNKYKKWQMFDKKPTRPPLDNSVQLGRWAYMEYPTVHVNDENQYYNFGKELDIDFDYDGHWRNSLFCPQDENMVLCTEKELYDLGYIIEDKTESGRVWYIEIDEFIEKHKAKPEVSQ